MKQEITVTIAPEADTRKETAKLSLRFSEQDSVPIDINGAALLKTSRHVPDLAQDFLSIASCIYATDKAVSRGMTEDKWTRDVAIQIPVEHADTWNSVADELSACVAFLTGDRWEISFRHGEKRLIQKKTRKRKVPYRRPSGSAVCLFSGGLDSFIGAVDWLTQNPSERLLLVGHYDRGVSGPATDQRRLEEICCRKYGARFNLAQTQVGVVSGSVETSFRSRSLLFIALGLYFAEVLGEVTPVLIPENGPIALNFPLTSARRGSCSTRTVHPYFINSLNRILTKVGIKNPVFNPYELKTKGEMVNECRDQGFLTTAYAVTRSCAKANRRNYWEDKGAPACGVCVPCLFRRASLYSSGRDNERFGKRIETINSISPTTPSDILALVAFLRADYSKREIAAGLLGNGSLPLNCLPQYVDLVERMRGEVLAWLRAKGSAFLKREVRGC